MRKARSLVPGRPGAPSARGSRGSPAAGARPLRRCQLRRATSAPWRPKPTSRVAAAEATTFKRETTSSGVTDRCPNQPAAKRSHRPPQCGIFATRCGFSQSARARQAQNWGGRTIGPATPARRARKGEARGARWGARQASPRERQVDGVLGKPWNARWGRESLDCLSPGAWCRTRQTGVSAIGGGGASSSPYSAAEASSQLQKLPARLRATLST